METKVILQKQDLTYLKWSHIRSSSGTAGTFLKAESSISGKKVYYKLSNYDQEKGVIGHECVNEIIVDRLLTLLGADHLHYQLVFADIEIDGRIYTTYLCASEDFKGRGESKTSLDNYFVANHGQGESAYDFCQRSGFGAYIDTMLAIDYLILNRDRHGANIEVLRNSRAHSLRIAPYFDHGLSFLFNCISEDEISSFDVMKDRQCNNFIGSRSCYENLRYIKGKQVFSGKLTNTDRDYLFEDLDSILSPVHMDRIWLMLTERYRVLNENI